MTQSLVTPWTFYLGDSFQTTFAYPWRIGAASDLEVYLADVRTTAYTVTGVGSATGGNVVFFNAPPTGQIVFIRRVTPQTQETDYVAGDPFGAEAHEAALDKLTRLVQDLYERIARSPAFGVTAPNMLRNLVFPAPGAGKVIGWDADGQTLTLYPSSVHQAVVDPSTGEVHGQTTIDIVSEPGAVELRASAFIPPGVELAGIGYRVTRGFSSELGLASIDLGGLGVTSRWGAALGITMDSTNNAGQWVAGRVNMVTAGDVVLLPNPPGSAFGALGTARLTCFFTTWYPR